MEPSKLIQVRSSSIAACASACELIYCYCNHLYLEQRHSSQALPVVPTGMPHAVRRLAANGELSLSLLRSAAAYACGTHPTSNVPLQRLYSTSPEGSCKATEGTFRAADLVIDRIEQAKAHKDVQDLQFGHTFTDHMFVVEHADGQGWGPPTIKPFGNLAIHPAAQTLHYGLCCFEGMKGYLGADKKARLFRPDMNMARMQRSISRLRLANYEPKELLACLKELLRIDKGWLPNREGYSMYIRPFAFSSAHSLGITKPSRSMICIVMSPVGPYFPTGLQPISLFLDEQNVRAWPGGVGANKVGTNYAPTIGPQTDAAAEYGTSQVIYSFPQGNDPDDALVSECGSMNMMFFIQKADSNVKELITPPLDGTILPGVTRDSILQLTREWGEFAVSERQLSIKEIKQASQEERLLEMFGCGTACIVQPVNELVRKNGDKYAVPFDLSRTDTLTQRLTRALTDIHYANVPHQWSVAVD